VTDPLQQAVVRLSSTTTGAAAEKYATVKNTKYSRLAREAGVLFKPLVVESLGAWCSQARGLFSAIGSRIAHRKFGGSSLSCTEFIYKSLSNILQKANARAILSRYDHSDSDFYANSI
jgi:hypothetical protein